jgi:HTH-type transcriptional regulator/antitoxin HigA
MPTVLDFTQPHVLRTEEEYDAAITEIEVLLDRGAAAGTAEYERLEFLSVLAEAYEKVHYPVERVRPQDVVEFRLEQKGMDRADLRDAMGGRSRVSEFFSGKRPLSRGQIERLRDLLELPADLLL